MKGLWMLAVLLIGVIAAVKITSWVNYFTFGENRDRREKNRMPDKD